MGSSNPKRVNISLKKQRTHILHENNEKFYDLDLDIIPLEPRRRQQKIKIKEERKPENRIEKTKIDADKENNIIRKEKVHKQEHTLQQTLEKKHSNIQISDIPHETYNPTELFEIQRHSSHIQTRKFKLIKHDSFENTFKFNKMPQQKVESFKNLKHVESFASKLKMRIKIGRNIEDSPAQPI